MDSFQIDTRGVPLIAVECERRQASEDREWGELNRFRLYGNPNNDCNVLLDR